MQQRLALLLQPWVVQGLQLTSAGVSPSVSSIEVAVTLVGFTLLYGGLAVVEVALLVRRIRGPVDDAVSSETDAPTPFSY